MEAVVAASDVTFSKLVALAGLNPKADFRYSNLRDVDFQDSDLRGFDFTGADLTGAIKNGNTKIDETTVFENATLAWVEGETTDIVNKMLAIQSASSSFERKKLLIELQERYRSAEHIRQFLLTSMKKTSSVEAFFDFANMIRSDDDAVANQVIRSEFKRLVEKTAVGQAKRRRRVAQAPRGIELIVRLLDETVNPSLMSVAQIVLAKRVDVDRAFILSASGGSPTTLI